MDDVCSMQGERRGAYMFLVGKYDRKRPLGKPWRRWEDSIKRVLTKSFGWRGLHSCGKNKRLEKFHFYKFRNSLAQMRKFCSLE
jgi:hypothetical protein